MRKLLFIIGIAFILASCTEDPPTLNISGKTQTIANSGGSLSATINANKPWNASSNVSWAKLSATSGQSGQTSLTITVDPSSETEDRYAKIVVTCSTLRDTITICQLQKNTIILEITTIEIPETESEFSVNVKYNINIITEITKGSDWIKAVEPTKAMSSKEFFFSAKENTTLEDRIGTIVFKSSGTNVSETLTVIQNKSNGKRLTFVHSQQTIKAPYITGSNVYGFIDWGDGVKSDYSDGATHQYADTKQRTVVMELSGNTGFKFSSIYGLEGVSIKDF